MTLNIGSGYMLTSDSKQVLKLIPNSAFRARVRDWLYWNSTEAVFIIIAIRNNFILATVNGQLTVFHNCVELHKCSAMKIPNKVLKDKCRCTAPFPEEFQAELNLYV